MIHVDVKVTDWNAIARGATMPNALNTDITMTEVIQIAREIAEKTDNAAVKRILVAFTKECPNCGCDDYELRRIVPPITVKSDQIHIVKYLCLVCGCLFKKVEENK